MLFPTLEFTLFCLLALSIYHLRQHPHSIKLVLIASFNIIFCSYTNPTLVAYLGGWAALLYISSKLSYKSIIVAIALFQLIFWKAVEAKFLPWHPIMPLGVSFFTFQGLTYLFALMKFPPHRTQDHIEEPWSFLKIFAFVGFFPTVFSGPILRAKHWDNQLQNPTQFNLSNINKALAFIAVGCFYKLCLASYLHDYVSKSFASPGEESFMNLLIGMYAYMFEIFHDFAGYSLMAIGVALLFGFSINPNFNRPYMASNIRDFWQRWHMSFSTWLRDYFYIALGGSRAGRARQIMNAGIVMLVCGAWHGLSFNYLVWGALHAVAICGYHLLHDKFKLPTVLNWLITFHFVAFTWIFFRSPDLHTAFIYLEQMKNTAFDTSMNTSWLPIIALFSICLISQKFENAALTITENRYVAFLFKPGVLVITWSTVFILILIASPSGMPPFIYFTY